MGSEGQSRRTERGGIMDEEDRASMLRTGEDTCRRCVGIGPSEFRLVVRFHFGSSSAMVRIAVEDAERERAGSRSPARSTKKKAKSKEAERKTRKSSKPPKPETPKRESPHKVALRRKINKGDFRKKPPTPPKRWQKVKKPKSPKAGKKKTPPPRFGGEAKRASGAES